jgi:hypothetical protein
MTSREKHHLQQQYVVKVYVFYLGYSTRNSGSPEAEETTIGYPSIIACINGNAFVLGLN